MAGVWTGEEMGMERGIWRYENGDIDVEIWTEI